MRLLYPLTVFLSAFLLFQIQPIITRIILPWFGGSAAVWTVCLLFFQVVLLLGYFYSHLLTSSLPSGRQKIVHLALLGASLLTLPILPRAGLKPIGGEDPTLKILLLLLLTVGLPYFLVSTTGPLLQAWYAARRPTAGEKTVSPYRLYALSNTGSMLALISYPIWVEPALTTQQQAIGWSVGYGLFALLCAIVAWKLQTNGAGQRIDAPTEATLAVDATGRPHIGHYLLWCGLAACSTTLLLAVTTHLSQDVAAIPFLWIVPLSLYLLSFIIVFAGPRWEWHPSFLAFPSVAIVCMAFAMSHGIGRIHIFYLIPLFSFGMFICCMVCHGELARMKPAPRYLTAFYLMISLGGAIGGLFVGFVAPRIFPNFYELPIGVTAAALFAACLLYRKPIRGIGSSVSWAFLLGLSILVGLLFIGDANDDNKRFISTRRNFYGVLHVSQDEDTRSLMYGTIRHGVQYLDDKRHMEPISYYGKESGLGIAMQMRDPRTPQRVAVIGLGTGTIAAFGRAGDVYRFYEINPLVVQVAGTEFRFLKDSKARIETVLGDARLSMEREKPNDYDLIAVDAFSGDAIPVHLITQQAIALYFRHLKPTGILAIHVSNRYLDLLPVVKQVVEANGKFARYVENDADDDNEISASQWVLAVNRPEQLSDKRFAGSFLPIAAKPGLRTWTDDYSNLFQILKRNGGD